MHFFIDPSALTDQSASRDGYGPVDGNEAIQWDVSANFQLEAPAPAFTCQAGAMIVTNHVDVGSGATIPSLVNVILKPSAGLGINFPSVKYYIYRGLQMSSFFELDNVVPLAIDSSELIVKAWSQWELSKPLFGPDPGLPQPSELGFDSSQANAVSLDIVFANASSVNPIDVTEGEWIGNFSSDTKIGFEVIFDDDLLDLNLGYARQSKAQVDLSGLPGLNNPNPQQAYRIKLEREKILSYVDPATFFGMHFDVGVDASSIVAGSKTTVPKLGNEILTDLLPRFASPSRVYLDVRSDLGYSYNFSKNYGDQFQSLIQWKGETDQNATEDVYHTHEWPIFFNGQISSTNSPSIVELKLRIDDNTKPLLFSPNPNVLDSGGGLNFIGASRLLGSGPVEWTEIIRLHLRASDPGGGLQVVPSHLQLHYFKSDNSLNPGLMEYDHPLDRIFGGLNLPDFASSGAFGKVQHTKVGLTKGPDFAYIPYTGAYFDNDLAVLFSEKVISFESGTRTYPQVDFDSVGLSTIVGSPVFPENIALNRFKVNEPLVGDVHLLEIAGYNENVAAAKEEDIFLIGMTRAELAALVGIADLDTAHQRYLVFNEVPGTVDANGVPFKKYGVRVQGLDDSGTRIVRPQVPTLFVYGTGSNILCTPDFSQNSNIAGVLPDPGTMEQFPNVRTIQYDETDGDVQVIAASGRIEVADIGTNYGLLGPLQQELEAEVSFPIDAAGAVDVSSAGPFPLVVIVHGNGHHFNEYTDLIEFLAKNGFVAASIKLEFNRRVYKMRRVPPRVVGVIEWDHVFKVLAQRYIYSSRDDRVGELDAMGAITLKAWTSGTEFEIPAAPPDSIKLNVLDIPHGGMGAAGRTEVLFWHLRVLHEKFGADIENNIGILGHSRGGEAVVRAAHFTDPGHLSPILIPGTPHNINAIMSLAPTDMYVRESLTRDIPYYVLYGSHDGDVSGVTMSRRKDGTAIPSGSGSHSLYDRANNSTPKAMSFVKGATHNGFVTTNHDAKDPLGVLTGDLIQKNILKAYTNAFFRMHLKGESVWSPYLQGDYIPISCNFEDIFPLYRHQGGETIVVDDFELFDPVDESSRGEDVIWDGGLGTLVEGLLSPRPVANSKDTQSPHETNGLVIDWEAGRNLTFSVPAADADVSLLNFLSFRITQVAKAVLAPYPSIDGLEIELVDGRGGNHSEVITRKIPDPIHRNNISYPAPIGAYNPVKSAMVTVRIPLSEYRENGVDLTNISNVTFIFPPGGPGKIAIDSIEFSN